jgi:hypothetical protein
MDSHGLLGEMKSIYHVARQHLCRPGCGKREKAEDENEKFKRAVCLMHRAGEGRREQSLYACHLGSAPRSDVQFHSETLINT